MTVVAVAGSLTVASSAPAATFCAGKPGTCPGTDFPTLTGAVNASNANGSAEQDRIEIGPGTFIGGQNATTPVDVVGEGTGATTIFSGAAGGTTFEIGASGQSTITDLHVLLDGDDTLGLRLDPAAGQTASASNVTVGDGPDAGAEVGVFLTNGATITDSVVTMPTAAAANTTGVASLANGASERIRIEAETGLEGSGTHRRLSIVAGSVGASGGFNLDNATIQLLGSGTALSTGFSGDTATARHVTAVGDGSGVGAVANGACVGTSGSSATLNLRNTILRGFSFDRSRTGVIDCDPGPPTSPAPATFEANHSIFDPAKTSQTGPGSFTENGATIPPASLGATNLNADPLFVGASDFHLTAGSPAIDLGDPATLGAGESTVDLDGNPRVVDGNADGTARRDIGAFERAVPDTDGDGVPDISDACPSVAAQTADGCPPPSGDDGSGGGDADRQAPSIVLGGKTKQRVDGAIEVKASCDEACELTGDGTVKVKRATTGTRTARAKAKKFGLGEDAASLAAGVKVTLELKLSKKAGRAITKALRGHRRVNAALEVGATDAAGNAASADRRVRLKPKRQKKRIG